MKSKSLRRVGNVVMSCGGMRRWLVGAAVVWMGCGPVNDPPPGDAGGDVPANFEERSGAPTCFVDFPCVGQTFLCRDDRRWTRLHTVPCSQRCGSEPCSGGSCDPTGPEESCPAGTRCVSSPSGSSATTWDARPSPCVSVDAGPDGSAPADAGP